MADLFRDISEALEAGENLAFVTVIRSSGSTPRGEGARMAAFSDGDFSGTVGGGAVEYESQKIAGECLERGESTLRDFDLSNEDAANLGMICGGDVTLHFQYIAYSERTADFFTRILELRGAGGEAWLATAIAENGGWAMYAVDSTKQVVARCGEPDMPEPDPGLLGRGCVLEAGGGEAPGTGFRMFVQPLGEPGRVYVFGGGHISQKLVPILRGVFFTCTVMDSEPAFVNRELFPSAEDLVICEFETALERVAVGPDDYVVILTRGHKYDYVVLAQALKTPARYIGMVGSRRKIDGTYRKLIVDDGFGMADLRRVHSPIGLPIGGETPEEIAISIAAQLIQVRSGREQ